MKYKDILLIDESDFEEAIKLLEEKGIKVTVLVSRKARYV